MRASCCRPEAADAERDLLAPGKYLVMNCGTNRSMCVKCTLMVLFDDTVFRIVLHGEGTRSCSEGPAAHLLSTDA